MPLGFWRGCGGGGGGNLDCEGIHEHSHRHRLSHKQRKIAKHTSKTSMQVDEFSQKFVSTKNTNVEIPCRVPLLFGTLRWMEGVPIVPQKCWSIFKAPSPPPPKSSVKHSKPSSLQPHFRTPLPPQNLTLNLSFKTSNPNFRNQSPYPNFEKLRPNFLESKP